MSTPPLRSHSWFGKKDLDGFTHRSWIKAEGFSELMFDGRPVIGIANSWSELTNCNAHLRQVAEAVTSSSLRVTRRWVIRCGTSCRASRRWRSTRSEASAALSM